MFKIILELFLISLIPIAASILMRLVMIKTKFKKMKYIWQQIIIGCIFGLISVFGTVKGIATTSGAIINIRDVPPICAGLIFGGPAGVIAGVIGGVYRYVSAFFGLSGTYTQIACSISTICAGVFTAVIRKLVFDNKHGRWYYGLGIGVLCESFHMLTVFFTHMNDIEGAYNAVINCALPMIIVNSLAVMFSLIGVALVSKEPLFEHVSPAKVATIIQVVLLISIFTGFVIISFFTQASLLNISDKSTEELLVTSIDDIKRDVDDQINRKLEEVALQIKADTEEKIENDYAPIVLTAALKTIRQKYGLSECSFINFNNRINYSTVSDYINFNMNTGEQSREFACLLGDTELYVQDYQPISKDSSVYMKYVGFKIAENESNIAYMQVGYSSEKYHALLDSAIEHSADNRRVGNDGFFIICNDEGKVLAKYKGSPIGDTIDISKVKLNEKLEHTIVNGDYTEEVYYYATMAEGYYVIAFSNKAKCDMNANIAFLAVCLTEAFIFLVMYCVIYVIIKKYVVRSVENINISLNKISDGDLTIVVNETTTYDFNSLSTDINKTVETLKGFIEREAQKIDEELRFAKNIQESSLPKHFPAFPNDKRLDLFASMDAAKSVGGDFYDFYKLGDDKIAILIADVSGKGIPAAMFMMKAKSIIKGLAENGLPVNEVMTEANKRLCEDNEAQMFVTAWLAFIDLKTGHVEFTNAGHNSPLIYQDGEYTYLKSKAGFVLAGMDIIRYKMNEIDLNPGDSLYLYTDGVTEAMNVEKKLYGEDRLVNFLNELHSTNPEEVCKAVYNNVKEYAGEEPQSDDITMLNFTYYGYKEEL